MTEQTDGHPCPECGAPREPDYSPTCACARRASDTLRATRTAQAAAVEDFQPLRIRPYVELDAPGAPGGGGRASATGNAGSAGSASAGTVDAVATVETTTAAEPAEATLTLRAVDPETTLALTLPPGPGTGPEAPTAAAVPAADPAQDAAAGPTSVLPTPLAPPDSAPSDTDLLLFEAVEAAAPPARATESGGGPRHRGRRRRRGLLLGATGGVVAIVTAAGYAGGLFSYQAPSRDTAMPTDLRASLPDGPAEASPEGPDAGASSASQSSQTYAPPSPSGSSSAPEPPSPSGTGSGAPDTPRKAPKPAVPAPTVTASGGTLSSGAGGDHGSAAPVLRRGDRGPEVTELQQRLARLNIYSGEANGQFNSQVENALSDYQRSRGVETGDGQLGVYGPDTRRRLESETPEP